MVVRVLIGRAWEASYFSVSTAWVIVVISGLVGRSPVTEGWGRDVSAA